LRFPWKKHQGERENSTTKRLGKREIKVGGKRKRLSTPWKRRTHCLLRIYLGGEELGGGPDWKAGASKVALSHHRSGGGKDAGGVA